jgi:hypothetical protein
MLYVVQAVMWGVAETPQLFTDEAKARSAYTACVNRCWEQRYSAYCEFHGVAVDAFPSAQAFVKNLDISEKGTVNYWTFDLEELESGLKKGLTVAQGEEFAAEIAAVRDGLTRLLEDVSRLADSVAGLDAVSAESPIPGGAEQEVPVSSVLQRKKPESDPEKYRTTEWKNFASTIKRLCCGSRNDCDLLPKDAWRQDVYSNRTSLEYWDWVADRFAEYREMAAGAGYTVAEEVAAPGGYRFANRQGITSEGTYVSEWEAWCAAGLHLEGRHKVQQ